MYIQSTGGTKCYTTLAAHTVFFRGKKSIQLGVVQMYLVGTLPLAYQAADTVIFPPFNYKFG